MYPNLELEMVRANITGAQLAKASNMSEGTFSAKRNRKKTAIGERFFTLDEAATIQKTLRSKLSIDKLFEWKDED